MLSKREWSNGARCIISWGNGIFGKEKKSIKEFGAFEYLDSAEGVHLDIRHSTNAPKHGSNDKRDVYSIHIMPLYPTQTTNAPLATLDSIYVF
jgi:hypothetical protein